MGAGARRNLPAKGARRNATRTDTVWPWSQIVPMMLDDMVGRYMRGGSVTTPFPPYCAS